MKKLFFAIALFISVSSFSQTKKENTPVDSTKKDSIETYAIILNENEIGSLINLLKEADEKPSIISQWIQFIYSRAQLLAPSNKEQPKK